MTLNSLEGRFLTIKSNPLVLRVDYLKLRVTPQYLECQSLILER